MIGLLLLAAHVIVLTPAAAAHTCKSYEGCDANGCTEGEDHTHTDMNVWPKRDESCKSQSGPSGDPHGCTFLGLDWPEAVCDLIDEQDDRGRLM